MTFTNAALIKELNIHNLPDAFIFGALVGIGYLVPMTMTISINPNFPRPFLYTAINVPYFLITSLVGSTILVSIG